MPGMNEEGRLLAGLRALARGMEGREAPPRVEATLLAEFRRRKAIRNTWRWAVAAAAVLAIVLAAASALRPRAREVAVTLPSARPAVAEQRKAPVTAEPAVKRRAPTARRAVRKRPRTTAPEQDRFVPVLYADDLASMESGQIVRVELPRSALAAFGIPIADDRPSARIRTDVLLGEDGTARAVRFVNFGR